jgi:hypothetical protein
MYAPGNLRAVTDNPQYEKLVNYYVQEKYTLRCVRACVCVREITGREEERERERERERESVCMCVR